MKRHDTKNIPLHAAVALSILTALSTTGCGGDSFSVSPTTPAQKSPQSYFSPSVSGTTNAGVPLYGPKTFVVDEVTGAFSESNFLLNPPSQLGPQVINAGVLGTAQRGLLTLGISTNYTPNTSTGGFNPKTYSPPMSGSFAVELAKQVGGFVQLVGQPVTPLGVATQCPSLPKPQSYLFLTLPQGVINSRTQGIQPGFWDPNVETAYGSADVSTTEGTVAVRTIQHHTLPSVGGSGTPTAVVPSSADGLCAFTSLGTTITMGQSVVQNPFPGGGSNATPQAKMSIGPTGLLVEDTGMDANSKTGDLTLGAGNGAIGLPKPSSPVDVSSLRAGQYLGFVYGSGVYANVAFLPGGWSSHLTSFGFSTQPAGCSTLVPGGSALLYGGDFNKDDPSTSPDGFGNCDLAMDLGAQDATTNGLFPNARLWIGNNYAANTTGITFSVPMVAIAGPLDGKYAIFALGFDSKQSWSVYLLQSN